MEKQVSKDQKSDEITKVSFECYEGSCVIPRSKAYKLTQIHIARGFSGEKIGIDNEFFTNQEKRNYREIVLTIEGSESGVVMGYLYTQGERLCKFYKKLGYTLEEDEKDPVITDSESDVDLVGSYILFEKDL